MLREELAVLLAGRAALALLVLADVLAGFAFYGYAQQAMPASPPAVGESGTGQPPGSDAHGDHQRLPDAQGKPEGGGVPKSAEDSAHKPADGAGKSRFLSILGREITNKNGDSGRVIDVLVDLDGHSGAVVVEFGGFMGIGSRKVAIDWNALRFRREGDRTLLIVDISREQIRDAAEYKSNEPTEVLSTK
ncbi:MAG TPA: PRC-barrel domain-containing protein [Hyphomicrobiaceae bacterium]|nr:PRC-barrel domain-containing protein [Hyphomicrobiaceae bacterium]